MDMKPDRVALRLRPIPANTAVHTPTKEEAKELLAILHENGYEWYHKCAPIPNPNLSEVEYINIYNALNGCRKVITYCAKETFVDRFLTLAEFKERYCEGEKPQPKFKVSDKVVIRWINKWGRITDVHFSEEAEEWEYNIKVNPKGHATALEHNIEPYTEPETNPTEDVETKDNTKELNLCELLREGDIVYSLIDGEGKVELLDENGFRLNTWVLRKDGSLCGCDSSKAKCLIYPSRALYEQYPLDAAKAWMKWQEEQMNRKTYIQIYTVGSDGLPQAEIDDRYYFRTAADRDKCIEVIGAFLSQIQQSKSVASLCEEIKAIIEKYSKK